MHRRKWIYPWKMHLRLWRKRKLRNWMSQPIQGTTNGVSMRGIATDHFKISTNISYISRRIVQLDVLVMGSLAQKQQPLLQLLRQQQLLLQMLFWFLAQETLPINLWSSVGMVSAFMFFPDAKPRYLLIFKERSMMILISSTLMALMLMLDAEQSWWVNIGILVARNPEQNDRWVPSFLI